MTIVTANTRLICVATGEYPVFLGQMGSRLVGSFGEQTESDLLEEFGYHVVVDTPVPAGDVVIEGAPELVDDEWRRTYIVRAFDEMEVSAQLSSERAQHLSNIEQFRITNFEKGFPCLFNGGTDLYYVQIRNKDLTFITALRVLAKEALEEATPFSVDFRVYEDVGVTLDAEEVVRVSNLANIHVQEGMRKYWDLKDATKAATSKEAFPEIPAEMFELK